MKSPGRLSKALKDMLRFLRDITGLQTGGGGVTVICCTVAGAVLLVGLVEEVGRRHGHVLLLTRHLRVTARTGRVAAVAGVGGVAVAEAGSAGVPVIITGGQG